MKLETRGRKTNKKPGTADENDPGFEKEEYDSVLTDLVYSNKLLDFVKA